MLKYDNFKKFSQNPQCRCLSDLSGHHFWHRQAPRNDLKACLSLSDVAVNVKMSKPFTITDLSGSESVTLKKHVRTST